MRKTRQFFTGLVLGLGVGMTFLIAVKIGMAVETEKSTPPMTTMYSPSGELEKCRCTIHLNPKAVPDMGQIERVK